MHEMWMPRSAVGGRNEVVTVVWPHGMIGIDTDSGVVRRVTDFPAWHPCVSRDGRSCVTDTKHPDRGLFLFDPSAGPQSPVVPLAESRSSNAGDHWNGDHCPYDDGPVTGADGGAASGKRGDGAEGLGGYKEGGKSEVASGAQGQAKGNKADCL